MIPALKWKQFSELKITVPQTGGGRSVFCGFHRIFRLLYPKILLYLRNHKRYNMRKIQILLCLVCIIACSSGRSVGPVGVIPAAEHIQEYLPLLTGKNIILVANQTSMIGQTHLADTLLSLGIHIVRIFSPEHGFRGQSDAGELVASGTDKKTGLPVVSLYGKHKKPLPEDLQDTDVVVFDIQDVGVRFYTYISTMHFVMEACAENGKDLIVLDRPNPNGNYIDGPVLEKGFHSFVGMDPVPVVYGMTIGEYARMINGEGWLKNSVQCSLRVIPCEGYTHQTGYSPPVQPSPNLPDITSIRLYPSLAFFEGTNVSVGRGTEFPFKVFGSPWLNEGDFSFTPLSTPGAALHPLHENEICRGMDLRHYQPSSGSWNRLTLKWLIWAYTHTRDKASFFNAYFNTLAGNSTLRGQIETGMTEEDIRVSWKPGLEKFRKTRERYLLYK